MPAIKHVNLGRNDESSAWHRGREDREAQRPLNEMWLARRTEVARAYRDGYEGKPFRADNDVR